MRSLSPHIEDQRGSLRGKKFFCSLDMTQGYYQIHVSPSSVHKTAFVTQEGQLEFLRMPFDVSNAPDVMDTVGAVGFALIFHPGPKKERNISATGSGFPVTS
jgi:hypothetical protein